MKQGLLPWLGFLAAEVTCLTHNAGAHSLQVVGDVNLKRVLQPSSDVSPSSGETSPTAPRLYSNTTVVRAIAADGETVWVATSGGLEQYAVNTWQRTTVYTTNDGLPSLDVDDVKLASNKVVIVSVAGHDCAMVPGTRRFSCSQRSGFQQRYPVFAADDELGASGDERSEQRETIEGASVTARAIVDDEEWLGTSGLGVWVRRDGNLTRVTPGHQIASNHVVAISHWNGCTWFATFDRGLSVLRNGQFSDVALSPRMLNDVLGTTEGLFVATSEGLFKSQDGETFSRDMRVPEPSITDLAYDPVSQTLYVTATNSLWELDLGKPHKYARATYQPGGTRSLQAVDVSPEGTVYLATEDRGVLRRDGNKRYTAFDRLAGYASSWVIDVLALGEQEALAGTLRHGLFSTHPGVTLRPTLDPWILFLGHDTNTHGTVFVGTQGGAAVIQKGEARALEGLPHSCVHTMVRLHDGLWVGTEGGLARYQ